MLLVQSLQQQTRMHLRSRAQTRSQVQRPAQALRLAHRLRLSLQRSSISQQRLMWKC